MLLATLQHASLDLPTPEEHTREWDEILAALRTELGISVGASDPIDAEPQEAAPVVGTGRLIGVVVNRRVRREDAGILHWLGLDVVSDEASAFTEDIRHYTTHLRAKKWNVAPQHACPVREEEQR